MTEAVLLRIRARHVSVAVAETNGSILGIASILFHVPSVGQL